MKSFNDYEKEMARERDIFDFILEKMTNQNNKQLIGFAAKSIADIFNSIIYEPGKEEDAIEHVALTLISYVGLILNHTYSSTKIHLMEKMFKWAASYTDLPSIEDMNDICEAIFENDNTPKDDMDVFHLYYSDSDDSNCELAHRLYVIGIVVSLLDKPDEDAIKRSKEQMEAMGLHRYVNNKCDTMFIKDSSTGESYYSCNIDMGGESA